MNTIQKMALEAIEQINKRADDILEDLRYDHWSRMEEIDFREEQAAIQRQIKEEMHPHKSIEQWWQSQTETIQSLWYDIYQQQQYGHGEALAESDHFGFEIVAHLRQQDSYLKQPFCARCDSRGHKSGDCIREAAQA